MCTPRNLHCWSDWSFTCCKTVEDPYCPVTVLLVIAIQCFALFTCFQIQHTIWKFCMKFGDLIIRKIFTICSNQIPDFKAKNPNPISAGLRSRYRCGGANSAPQTFKLNLTGILLRNWKRRSGKWECDGEGKGEKRRGPPRVGSQLHVGNPEKMPWLQNWCYWRRLQQDVCPGRQTASCATDYTYLLIYLPETRQPLHSHLSCFDLQPITCYNLLTAL